MTGSAKQSIPQRAKTWIASSLRSSQRRLRLPHAIRGGAFANSTAIAEISGFMK